jgi:hypothetical protein
MRLRLLTLAVLALGLAAATTLLLFRWDFRVHQSGLVVRADRWTGSITACVLKGDGSRTFECGDKPLDTSGLIPLPGMLPDGLPNDWVVPDERGRASDKPPS